MSSYCVRKPYTVVVAVIMVLVLGVISFFGMTTDLLPTLELPYIVVVTTYPGADPERVETGVTAVLESGLGTVNGVSNVQSVSSENMSMVILEFEESTNMDSAMVKLSSAVDQVKGALPETGVRTDAAGDQPGHAARDGGERRLRGLGRVRRVSGRGRDGRAVL